MKADGTVIKKADLSEMGRNRLKYDTHVPNRIDPSENGPNHPNSDGNVRNPAKHFENQSEPSEIGQDLLKSLNSVNTFCKQCTIRPLLSKKNEKVVFIFLNQK